MPVTYRSRQLRLERDLNERFGREHNELGRTIGRLILLYGVYRDGVLIIPNSRTLRDAIRAAVWSRILRPYYIGNGDDPFNGTTPLSPFARLIFDGVQAGIEITAEQQAAIVRQATTTADDVYNYLTGPRPFLSTVNQQSLRGWYDPFHRFVDPNGYKLSDRIWRDAVSVRARVDQLLDYHISRGTSAVEIAKELEQFLTPGAAVSRTNTPYGREGSYAARRLARTEITASAGRATVNASIANPFVTFVRWVLSLSHKCCDICDTYAAGGEKSDGAYLPENLPTYPAHPHEMCNIQPVVTSSRADTIARIRADMRTGRTMQGLMNPAFLASALTNGFLSDAVPVGEMAYV